MKQAASLERRGIRSAVLADGRLVTARTVMAGEAEKAPAGIPTARIRQGPLRRLWSHARSNTVAAPLEAIIFIAWLGLFVWRWFLRVVPLLPPADVYILHEFSQFPAVWLAARRYRSHLVYDVHDYYTGIEAEDRKSRFDRRWLTPFFRCVETRCMRSADQVWTVSPQLAELLEKTYGRRATVIRNCHDFRLDEAPAPENDLRRRLGLADDDFLLLTIGNCKPGQAIAAAFEALGRLPENVHLAFLGGGYEAHRSDAASRHLEHRVHLLGRIAPDRIVPLACGADAGLILYYPRSANYLCALPNGFFQSLAAGLPLIAPTLPSIRHLVEEFGSGLIIDVSDPEQLENAVHLLLKDGGPMESFRAGSRNARRVLNWENEEALMIRSLATAHP